MSLVLTPIITEKSLHQAAHGVYTFQVPMQANKLLVAQAVKEVFNVDAVDVRMAVQKGKTKTYRQMKGRRADRKKAFVQLAKGQKITAFDLGQEEPSKDAKKADKKAAKAASKKEAK